MASASVLSSGSNDPAWCRRVSMAFTKSHGGLAPSTLNLLHYDALSTKADLPTATSCAAAKVSGTVPRLLEHRPESIKAAKQKTRVITEVRHDKALVHHLREPAARGLGNPTDAKTSWYYPAHCFRTPTDGSCSCAPTGHNAPMNHHGQVQPPTALMAPMATALVPVQCVPMRTAPVPVPAAVQGLTLCQPAPIYYAPQQDVTGAHHQSMGGHHHEPSPHHVDSPYTVFFHTVERSPSWQGRFGGPFRQHQGAPPTARH